MATPSPAIPTTTEPLAQAQRLRMTYEAYLAWADEDRHAAWVNGEVIVQMASRYGPSAEGPDRQARALLAGLLLPRHLRSAKPAP